MEGGTKCVFPCWIQTHNIDIVWHTLYPAEPHGHQNNLRGLKDICCHGNTANNIDVSFQHACKGKTKKRHNTT